MFHSGQQVQEILIFPALFYPGLFYLPKHHLSLACNIAVLNACIILVSRSTSHRLNGFRG